jgi:DNA polymerase-3 subunit beta
MEFHAKRYVLWAMLDKASKVVPSRDTMPVLKNFYVEATPDEVRVAATDLELSLIVDAQLVHVDQPGSAIIPSRKLLEIVAAAEDEEAYIRVADGRCHIDIGRASWTLTINTQPDAYPPLPDVSAEFAAEVNRAELLGAFQMVERAAGRATARPNLMVLDIHDGKVTGTDGVRCQQVRMESWPANVDMQIPIGAVDELIRLLRSTEAETIEVAETEDHLLFRVGQDLFVANSVAMEFPPVDQQLVVPALENDQRLTCDREELTEALRRVRITADPDTSAVVMDLTEDTLTLRCRDKMANESVESIDCGWSYEDRSVVVNHVFLMDMLKMADARTCEFYLGKDKTNSRSPLLLRDESKGMVGIVSQMRADWVTQ